MKLLTVDNQSLELNDDGFLNDRSLWNPKIAEALAMSIGISLQKEHWQIINFTREFYFQHDTIPPLRIFIKQLKTVLGPEIANSIRLHQLFPQSPMKLICLIGGLPKPKHCM